MWKMSSDSSIDSSIPQWKKELIARLRSQNRRTANVAVERQLYGTNNPPQPVSTSAAVGRAVQQPSLTCSTANEPSSSSSSVGSVTSRSCVVREKCNNILTSSNKVHLNNNKMVQERSWEWSLGTNVEPIVNNSDSGEFNNDENGVNNDDSDSSEDLQYGPGIVHKLREKYLSLALRSTSNLNRKQSMRKATSLENLLDEPKSIVNKNGTQNARLFQSRLNGSNDTGRNVPNRYHRNYSGSARGSELKRARSVEAILRAANDEDTDDAATNHAQLMVKPKRESLHEEMLISNNKVEGSDKYTNIKTTNDNNLTNNMKILEQTAPDTNNKSSSLYVHRKNRPKRIAPMMNAREKPPVDVVKQNKMIFEKCTERTKAPQQTGKVAAKIATFTSIISENKSTKTCNKPPIKAKPILDHHHKVVHNSVNGVKSVKSKASDQQHQKAPKSPIRTTPPPSSLSSPIPDISRVDFGSNSGGENEKSKIATNLSETPDLIMTSTPPAGATSPTYRILATENFIKQEIHHSNNNSGISSRNGGGSISPVILSPTKTKPVSSSTKSKEENDAENVVDCLVVVKDKVDEDVAGVKKISRESIININNASNTMTFNFVNNRNGSTTTTTNSSNSNGSNILPTNKNILNTRTPPSQPLKVEIINGIGNSSIEIKSPKLINDNISPVKSTNQTSPTTAPKPTLTIVEIEKNLKNSAKIQEQKQNNSGSVIVKSDSKQVLAKVVVPKVKTQPQQQQSDSNSIVFKFTHRKDVPDYVHNEGTNRSVKIEKPKVGEGGIILLPGATIDFTDDDDEDEIMRSLEGPPSPCDVTFINDNVLIDGKSSLSQKRKKAKLRITFVDDGPQIFEYPSESSMMKDDSPSTNASSSSSSSSSPSSNAQMGHAVPSLTGTTSLANYTPRANSEEFQPGVTRSIVNPSIPIDSKCDERSNELSLQEADEPIVFSAGTNSDILF